MHDLPYFKNSIGQWFIKHSDHVEPLGPFADELALGYALAKLNLPAPKSDRNAAWEKDYGKKRV